jgi:hypothetical protein
MLVLLDNDVPYGLRRLMRPHVCFHAKQLDWTTLANGLLIRAAEGRKFDVMITADQSIFYQQNNSLRTIALVQLSTPRWKSVQAACVQILEAVAASHPGSFQRIEIPLPRKSRR